MKKLLTLVLFVILAINCTAVSVMDSSFNYTLDDKQITIEFTADSVLSTEKQQQVANHIVHGDDGTSTYAWCWLTGHDYVYESVIAIEHKVATLSPRCMKRTYSVETCSKCDHIEETLLSEVLIACCAEE